MYCKFIIKEWKKHIFNILINYMKKILVTGGTGLVGSHLLYQLVQSGNSPIAIHRHSSDIMNVKKIFSYYSKQSEKLFNQISWFECDILDVLLLDNIVRKATHIYHCAALISFNSELKNDMLDINTTGTANIIDLSLKHGIKRICYVSSIATLGSNHQSALNEDCFWEWKNKSSYAISKYLAEMEVWRGFAEGLSGFIVNPSLIIGPGSWSSGIGTIINRVNWGLPFYPPGKCGVIDVNDLSKIMIQLMNSCINNERFIINADHISYKKLMSIISKNLNKKEPFIALPSLIIKILISIEVVYKRIFKKRIELNTDAVNYTTSEIILDSSKINKNIEFQYRDMKESIKECVGLFKEK